METISDFKRAMKLGSRWIFTADWNPVPIIRICRHADTVKFGLSLQREEGTEVIRESISYCNWPKRDEILEIGENHIKMRYAGSRCDEQFLRYERVEGEKIKEDPANLGDPMDDFNYVGNKWHY